MTWGAVAVAGASLVGGALSSSSADKATGAQQDATAAQAQAAREELDFAKEQYADWTDVYGPIQDQLSSYYASLGPEYYEAEGLEAFQKEQDQAFTQLQEQLTQRGVWDDGVGAAVSLQKAITGAEERASIRAEAPRAATEDARQFLQVGLGQDPTGDIQQALRSQTSVLGQQAVAAGQTAATAQQAEGQAWSSAIGTVGTALGDYLDNREA